MGVERNTTPFLKYKNIQHLKVLNSLFLPPPQTHSLKEATNNDPQGGGKAINRNKSRNTSYDETGRSTCVKGIAMRVLSLVG